MAAKEMEGLGKKHAQGAAADQEKMDTKNMVHYICTEVGNSYILCTV